MDIRKARHNKALRAGWKPRNRCIQPEPLRDKACRKLPKRAKLTRKDIQVFPGDVIRYASRSDGRMPCRNKYTASRPASAGGSERQSRSRHRF